MTAVSILRAALAAGAGLCIVACGNGDDTYAPVPVTVADGGGDASKSGDATLGDAEGGMQGPGASDAEDEDGQPPVLSLVRVANWSADSPAVDVCLAPHGTGAFRGPLLSSSAAAINEAGVIDAGSGALPFPQTSDLFVEPAQYDARVVAAGSVNCSTGITPDATTLPALAPGGLQTIALVGAAHPEDGESGLQLVSFIDEVKNSLQGALLIRVINAAVDLPKAEVGTYDPPYLSPFLPQPVLFGASSAGDPMADPNGYIADLPIMSQTIAARAAVATLLGAPAHTIVARAPAVSLASGASVTFVVIGANAQIASDGGIGALLECVDNAGSVGLQGRCRVVSD